MYLYTIVFLALLCQTRAAPQTIVTQWPPKPPLPSFCGFINKTPACPIGYKCVPRVPRFCTDLGPSELCGSCMKVPTRTSTPVTSTITTQAAATTTCPSGFTPDYRNYCRKTTTIISSATPFSCPSGFTPDYRGMSYCRPTIRPTSATNTPSTPFITCSVGSYADYRGICRASPTSNGYGNTPTTLVEKRTTTTTVDEELKCDTRRDPKCPQDLRCQEIRECPPFIAFCPGTCVGWQRETKVAA
jgi:hypothetical protein